MFYHYSVCYTLLLFFGRTNITLFGANLTSNVLLSSSELLRSVFVKQNRNQFQQLRMLMQLDLYLSLNDQIMYVSIYYFNYRLVDNNIDQIGQAVTVESVVVRNASTIPLIVCRFVRDMNNYTQLPIYSMNGMLVLLFKYHSLQTDISSAHYSATKWPRYTAHTVYCHWSTGRPDCVSFLLLLHMLLFHVEVGYSLKQLWNEKLA